MELRAQASVGGAVGLSGNQGTENLVVITLAWHRDTAPHGTSQQGSEQERREEPDRYPCDYRHAGPFGT
jgi:hypothetical protein